MKTILQSQMNSESSNVYVYQLSSRNKDNSHIKNFKPRTHCFLVDLDNPTANEVIQKHLNEFMKNSKKNEVIRKYKGINPRNMCKVHKQLITTLLNDEIDLLKLTNKIVSIADKQENRCGNKFLVDIDYSDKLVAEDVLKMVNNELKKCTKYKYIPCELFKTYKNYGIILPHGIDSRLIVKKYPNVEMKRDARILEDYYIRT